MRLMLPELLMPVVLILFANCGGDMERELLRAASSGDVKTVATLLTRGVNPNAIDDQGNTALMVAAQKGHLTVAEALLAGGADVNAKRRIFDYTALMDAAYGGHEDIVNLLLSNGANVNARGVDGASPLMLAVLQNYRAIVYALIDKGADVNATDGEGQTPLRTATFKHYTELANALKKAGALE